MRLFGRRATNEEETVQARAEWIGRELVALQGKSPEEVAGTPEEPAYYGTRLAALCQTGGGVDGAIALRSR